MVIDEVFKYLFGRTETCSFPKKIVSTRNTDKHLTRKEDALLELDSMKELKKLEWSWSKKLSVENLDLLSLYGKQENGTISSCSSNLG